jgi:hypothetical protein
MGPARRLFSFVCSLGLTLAGFVLALWGFSNGGRGWLFMAAGTMLFAGACWLWSDFINATPNDQLGRFKQKANGRQRQQDANWEREPTAEAQEWWHILDVSPHAKRTKSAGAIGVRCSSAILIEFRGSPQSSIDWRKHTPRH